MNESAIFLAAKDTLLSAMRHHAVIQALTKSKVIQALGYDPYAITLTDDQIDAVCQAESDVEEELNYWLSANAVKRAKDKFIEASKPLIEELVPAEHLEIVQELYRFSSYSCTAHHKLANLLLRWAVK